LRVCAAAGDIVLEAVNAKVNAAGSGAKFEPGSDRRCIGFWKSTNVTVSWTVQIPERATYRVVFIYATIAPAPPEVEVTVGGQRANGFAKPTGDWGKFEEADLGPVMVRKPGTVEVVARVTRMVGANAVNLRAVKLVKEP
jgi:hypothetical protein